MSKLSENQLHILMSMRDGKQLLKQFSPYISRPSIYYLNGQKCNTRSVESLEKRGYVKVTKIDMTGNTTHIYSLTQSGIDFLNSK